MKNECQSLYRKIMFIIERGELTQYGQQPSSTPKVANPTSFVSQNKGKSADQAKLAKQTLQMVPMIVGRAELVEAEERQSKQKRKTEE